MKRSVKGRGWAAALALAAAGAAAPAVAQTALLDEGTFRISIGGREVGTERFQIQRSGTGAQSVIIARGRVTLDAQEVTSSAQLAGETLRPAGYEVEVRGGDGQKIQGTVIGGRFSARIQSEAGENMREYLVSEGAMLADEGIAHHYYFLLQRVGSGSARVPLLIPRESRQVSATVESGGSETIQVGGQSVSARRVTVTPAGGAERIIWADAQGRVLRVQVPARQYVAERTAMPG
jgi:hypothetical protein